MSTHAEKTTRVLVVDDMAIYRKVISEALRKVPGVEVIGTAANGKIALDKTRQLQPDLVVIDIEIPELNGLEVLAKLRAGGNQVGVVLFSTETQNSARYAKEAHRLGATDFVLKPQATSGKSSEEVLHDLCGKIERFSKNRIHVSPVPSRALESQGEKQTLTAPPRSNAKKPDASKPPFKENLHADVKLVVIGISTGGPEALAVMLPGLPANLAAPVLIVQHMPPVFTKSLADELNKSCPLHVAEAKDGDLAVPGTILIAPGGKHMMVDRVEGRAVVRVCDGPQENNCRPSVDCLFRSAAHAYGASTLGVIMTGMGYDGTAGCRLLKEQGATVIAQSEETCVVFGMPRLPCEEGLADVVAPLNKIASCITQRVNRKEPHEH